MVLTILGWSCTPARRRMGVSAIQQLTQPQLKCSEAPRADSAHLSPMLQYSFQAKLLWARQHLDGLRQDIFAFHQQEPCAVVHGFDRETGKHIWRVDGPPKLPQKSISLRLGDLLYNWRGALDHLAWSLVLANGNSPTERTCFPIVNSANDWNSTRVQRQVAGMHPQAIKEIEEFQPYNSECPYSTNELLGLLNRLGNVEKHRHFNLTVASIGRLCALSVEDHCLTEKFIHQGPVEDGTVVASCISALNISFIAMFEPAFGQGGIAAGEGVDELMLKIGLAVEETMILASLLE